MKRPFEQGLFDHFDWALFGCTALIILLGLLNLYSATLKMQPTYFRNQSMWVLLGAFVILIIILFDYRILERLAYPIYFVTLALLLLVMLKGRSALGAQRWLQVGPLSIQPSELIKPAMAIALARFFNTRRNVEPLGLGSLIWPFLLTAVPAGLILKQPDLGTAIIVSVVSITMILFAGIDRKILISGLIIALIAVPLVWKYGLHDYQRNRVYMFLDPEKDAKGKGYQIIQSRIAIGSGQLTGVGYLKGTQSKLDFLPKKHTDFAFSNFAEEFGFVGAVFIVLLYGSLAFLGINVAQTAKEKFGMMMAFGMTSLIASQAVVNLGMELGMLPVVGVPLPLFSYGGTSLLSTMLAVGILLNISMRRYLF